MPPAFLLLDVDNTLYPRRLGVVDHIDARINRFLCDEVGIPHDEVDDLRRRLWAEFGTTLFGLMHRLDIADRPAFAARYAAYVHDIPHAELLTPQPALVAMLAAVPLEKVAVTNGSGTHAQRVLACLGLDAVVPQVFALEHFDWIPKPHDHAFHTVLTALGTTADACIFVEDTAANIGPARRLGMRTIHVAEDVPPADDAEVVISSIEDLPRALATFGVTLTR